MGRLLVFFLLSVMGCKRPVAQEVSTINISGTVFQTEAYCGGAAPNQKMIEDLQKPKPLSGKKLYIKKGKENDPEAVVVAEATADERGEFALSLSPGWYVIVDENKKDKASFNYMMTKFAEPTDEHTAVDKKCLEAWVKKAELAFEVREDSTGPIEVTFHKPCSWNSFPCVKFTGARPR